MDSAKDKWKVLKPIKYGSGEDGNGIMVKKLRNEVLGRVKVERILYRLYGKERQINWGIY